MSEDAAGGGDAPYWQALKEGRLSMQHCQACRHWHWPAVERCGECGAWDPEWRLIAMSGELFSWATTWHPFGGTEGIGVPYTTVLVSLPQADGLRLLGLWEGDEGGLRPGEPVVARVAETKLRKGATPALRWRSATGATR